MLKNIGAALLLLAFFLTGCAAAPTDAAPGPEITESEALTMQVQIGEYRFTAVMEENEAVSELLGILQEGPLTLELSDYAGFEKVGPLGRRFTADDRQTTTLTGDIVLYNSSNIVMFYGSNSWSYTRLGKIEDLTDWEKALGSGDVTVTLSLE